MFTEHPVDTELLENPYRRREWYLFVKVYLSQVLHSFINLYGYLITIYFA